ncbi:MAG: hypothetical protein Q4A78_12000 [Peptostreptococcaceae bacterium]|nr:hypothetical protein [Peptostreptococcaceae bacterium]
MKQKLRLSVKQLLQYGALMMLTGSLTGIGLKESLDALLRRKGLPGGEILFVPMLILVFLAGYQVRQLFSEETEKERLYRKGLAEGMQRGSEYGQMVMYARLKLDEEKEAMWAQEQNAMERQLVCR